ncbi:non-ribosomal peptide synthetase [Pseudoalteromonas sp. MMG005]|uniref:non-ribosomal peptide synthetase n=1 Tax=Pseudoalteromonas sp. MMG005 TaxID=2822682 RepID=UPI001B3A6BA3|nr:non-ribosomal peptide synthetase [Pseudoalteromonas sp. MMG005]MBQ4848294.1 amino acid adenylation domain-containing protein [Pseudoalteromonas sp. MMG005]
MDIDNTPLLTEKNRKRAELVKKLAQKKRQQKLANKQRKIARRPEEVDTLPLSFAQKRLWFLDKLSDQGSEYNISGGFTITGNFDLAIAETALEQIIRRHEVLRTVYSESDIGPVQRVKADAKFTIKILDHSQINEVDQVNLVEELTHQECSKPFDLRCDLMIRASYISLPRQGGQAHGVLLFSMHHIASDGWSMEIVTREFVAEYQALVNQVEASVTEPEIQYGDFSLWQQEHLDEHALQQQVKFWQCQLEDVPAVHNLPLDNPRPEFKNFQGERLLRTLDSAFSSKALAFAKRQGLTPFMLVHAVLTLVMSRCSNQSEFIIGMPAANRMKSELQNVVGFFVNTLVLKASISADSIDAFLEHIKTVNLDAQSNQDVPFEQVVEHCVTSRSGQYTPLFQILLSTSNGDSPRLSLPGIHLAAVERKDVVAKFDIDINVTLNDKGGQINWVYNSEIFNSDTITQFAEYMECAWASLLTCIDTSQSLSQINMLSDVQLASIVKAPEQLCEIHPLSDQVHLHFSALAQRLASETAVVTPSKTINYEQLEHIATCMALHLQELGVKSGDVVAVMMARDEYLIASILGIMKLGAAYLPVSPTLPETRLKYIIEDAGVSLVVTSEPFDLKLSDGAYVRSLCVDEVCYREILSHYVTQGFVPNYEQSDQMACYVIYTSGSTGNPKGVEISHRSALQFGLYMGERFGISTCSKILQFATISFDAFIMEWQWALLNGGTLYFCTEQSKTEPMLLAKFIQQQQITHTLLPPAFLRHLPRHDDYHFEALLVGGEACDESLSNQWAKHYPMYNAYGPTESTVCASIAKLCPQQAITIGKPIDKTHMYVLSPDGQLLPPGFIGELVIAGEGLALGYLNNPELTQQRFVESPLGLGTWYFTGDIVRQNIQGEFEYLGRSDDQVSIKGFRVELGEIKQKLLANSGVTAAEVIVKSPSAGQKKLLAYIIANKTAGLSSNELIQSLKRALKSQLPDYMIPAGFAVLEAYPMTNSGKIDKQALPEIDVLTYQETYQAPSNAQEEVLTGIYAQLLGLPKDKLSVTSNFFELGGDSILSIQLVSRAARAGLHFSVKQLFSHQTIQALAVHLSTTKTHHVSQQASEGQLPLLPIHQTFFADKTDLHHFNQAVMLGCHTPLTMGFLTQVIATLVAQHDALRLHFKQDGEKWYGEFSALSEFDIDQVLSQIDVNDFSHIPDLVQEIQQSLDITAGPLFRLVLFRQSNQQRLFIVCHHLIIDGVSWRILLEDFEHCLTQANLTDVQTELSLGLKTNSYQQWCEYLNRWPNAASRDEEIAYWRSSLTHDVPTYSEAKQAQAFISAEYVGTLQFALSQSITEQLLQKANIPYRTQINELLLAALVRGFSLWSGHSNLRLDLEGHGREELSSDYDLSRTLGWFTTTFPLTLKASNDSLEALICTVKEQYRAIPNKGIGFGLLREAGHLIEAESVHSEVVFNYLGQFKQVINDTSTLFGVEEGTGQAISAKRKLIHGLNFNGKILAEQLQFTLSYDKKNYDRSALERLNQLIVTSLEEIVAHCCELGIGVFTPSDFPLAILAPDEVKCWTRDITVQDIYAATPMQEGMLFHSNLERSAYANQLVMDIEGEVDLIHLRAAWQAIIDRYDIFRTGFMASELGAMNQVVSPQVILPWQELDLSNLDDAEQQTLMNQMRSEDKVAGFNLAQPPLVRVTVWHLGVNHYRLLWTQHHALIDGWCSGIVFSELMAIYQAISCDVEPKLPRVTPYKHYIKWLQSKDYAKAEQFWQAQVGSISQRSVLPFSRRLEKAPEVAREYLVLSQSQTEALTHLAKQTRTTLNVVLQAAWAILLSRANRTETVTFGTTVSGRPADLEGVESMVGLFINTIPAVVTVDGKASVCELLTQLQQGYIDRDEFSYYPLSKIQKLSQEHTQQGLFDSLFVFENYPRSLTEPEGKKSQGLQVKNIESQQGNNFPLSLIASHSDVLKVKLEYHSNYYSQYGIEQLSTALSEILQAMAVGSDEPVAELCWLSPAQKEVLLTRSGYDRQTSMLPSFVETVNQQIAAHPCLEAVFCDGQSTTYRQLNDTANDIAHLLTTNGIVKGSKVGICLEKSTYFLATILATFRVGAAFVPLEKAWPVQRIEYIANDAKLCVIVTDRSTANSPTESIKAVHLGELRQQEHTYDMIPSESDTAYIIYTSGTTGNPKGVAVSHGNISHYVQGILSRHYINEHAKYAMLTSFATDLGYTSLFLSLATAGSLDITSDELIKSGEAFTSHINTRGINVLKTTPSLLAALLVHYEGELVSLSHVFVGGETIQADAQRAISDLVGKGITVINHYGPTETTIGACTYTIANAQAAPIPIGRPIAGMQACVVDEDGHLVPDGIVGELFLSGVGVSQGYIAQPTLTKAVFTPDPFATSSLARRYATGDLVYRNEAGELVYIGRKDNQVKVRGFRVELEEVESTLLRSSNVDVAVALLNAEGSLVAYVKLRENTDNNKRQLELTQLLHQWLPEHMVPSFIVPIEEVPLKANGKIDKGALPSIQKNEKRQLAETQLEQQIAQIWAQYLGCDAKTIGTNDNFYELGGDSLKMILVIGQFKKVGIKITAQQMAKIDTIAGVVSLLEAHSEPQLPGSVVTLSQTANEIIFAVHPYGGRVDNYRQLAEQLHPDYQLLGLQAPYNYSSDYRFNSAQQLAELYVQHILQTQKQGPYRIIGWSAGGTLAHLIASLLQERGEHVAYLGLLDAAPVGVARSVKTDKEYLLNSARYVDRGIASKLGDANEYAYDELMAAITESVFTNLPDFPMTRTELNAALQFGVDLGRGLAMAPAISKSLDAEVAVFKAMNTDKEQLCNSKVATAFSNKARIFEFDATHASLLEGKTVVEITNVIKRSLRHEKNKIEGVIK